MDLLLKWLLANEERYRSGHNGAASKADGCKPRGFESRPLRFFITVGAAFAAAPICFALYMVLNVVAGK